MPTSFAFEHAPGYLIRRAHQMSVSIFMDETSEFGITPVQFAILNALMDKPGEDQISLSERVAFDPATSGSVISRLEAKGFVRREADAGDRRRKLLRLSDEGQTLALKMKRSVAKVQSRMLEALTSQEQAQLVALLRKVVLSAHPE